MFSSFTTTTHGKWILTGEHAVIRGHAAIVFPILNKKLTLSYHPQQSTLGANFTGECGNDLHLLFWSVLEHGAKILDKQLNTFYGYFEVACAIPIGVGMGASAALCVAIARWFAAQKLIAESSVQTFSTELENLFHGKSSGLDIAGVSATKGITFQQGNINPLQQTWKPHWYLSSCEQVGITSHCIHQVQNLWKNDPTSAKAIDWQMQASVQKACEALSQFTNHSLEKLTRAIHLASDCFQRWGLISESLQHHMSLLQNAGAIAVKPTGSGGGGFVLSLWDKPIAERNTLNLLDVS